MSQSELIGEASAILKSGGTAVLPTDTVPGIGCLANNPVGITRLFELKNRPANLAIPVILADAQDIRHYALDLPISFIKLADRYWPGPLTIVVGSNGKIDPQVGGGLATLGFRVPNAPLLRKIVRAAGFPVALTSANPHNAQPTTQHETLVNWWDGQVDLIVLGESVSYGPPSTVVDISDDPPVILREGSISKHDIMAVLREKVPESD
jgi:L-threonylcarbamoyladenylate synthase